jgi:hypothetical protein
MELTDFYNLMTYLKKREKIRKNEPVELKQGQKDMIKKFKELKKKDGKR